MKVPSEHHWEGKRKEPKLTPKNTVIAGITAMTLVSILSRLDCDCDAHDNNVEEDIVKSVDVDRLEVLHTYGVEGETDPMRKATAEKVADYTMIWNWRKDIATDEDGFPYGDFICDHYVKGEKAPSFRNGMYHVFMFGNKGEMYKVRSKYLQETWRKTGGDIGGDTEILNRQKYPQVERRGILKIPKK